MSAVLDDYETQDGYTAAGTLTCVKATVLTVDVFDNGIYFEVGHQRGAAIEWTGVDVPLPPGFRSLDLEFDHVRVKSRTPGNPAFVDVNAR